VKNKDNNRNVLKADGNYSLKAFSQKHGNLILILKFFKNKRSEDENYG